MPERHWGFCKGSGHNIAQLFAPGLADEPLQRFYFSLDSSKGCLPCPEQLIISSLLNSLIRGFIVVMHRQASKKETNKHQDRSLDDFLKHFKRYNLKSERHDRLHSPDLFAPYRQNTTHTLERSRTLSGKQSRKTNKTTRCKREKILERPRSKAKGRVSTSNIVSKS